ncbi:MAG: hypothetical protein AB7Q16_10185 [Vicinamibacterales bacterium]
MSIGMASFISLLVGLGAGALGLRALSASGKHTTITVRKDSRGWQSTTADQTVRLRRLMSMRWHIEEATPLPGEAHVELRFAGDNSPFTDRRPKDDRRPRRTIGALVPTGVENASYKYEVWLVEGDAQTRLEDPVIVIEGKRG